MTKKTYRPIPFYFITTSDMNELTYEKAYESLSILKERGFGGAILFNKPPHGFNAQKYLSDDWFEMIENFVRAGAALDLEMWINDGFDYPPGAAAGRIKEIDPTLKQMRIKRENGKIVTQEVEAGFPAFECEKSSQLFIELVYEEYKKRLGKYFGKEIRGIFSDADNRRINTEIADLSTEEKTYFPWSKDFPETFRKKYGYDIMPFMNDVFDRKDVPQAADYWKHCSDLYTQWFKNNYEWCKKNNLEYTFHTSDTSPFTLDRAVRSSAFTEGRFLDVEINCDYCGTDQELLELNGGKHYTKAQFYVPKMSYGDNEDVRKSDLYYDLYEDVRTKQAQSCAFLNDKKGTMCEMFAATNYGVTYDELREIAAFQIMQGVSFIVSHAYHYRLLGETKYFAPPDFSDKGHLKNLKELNDVLALYASWGDKGSLVAPVAVMDITDDLWKNKADTQLFLSVCHALNRTPFGYVIADKKGIEKKKNEFSLIINTSSEKIESLYGIKVVNLKDIEELNKALSSLTPDVTYSGEGTPHFMVRKTDEGLCALVANIENGGEIEGTVTFSGKEYCVKLSSGEIAFFSEKEQIYRRGEKVAAAITLPKTAKVVWEKENLLPITVWTDDNGNTVLQQEEAESISFAFDADGKVKKAALWIPDSCMQSIEKIDGIDMKTARKAKFLDDDYTCFDMEIKEGRNTVTIKRTSTFSCYGRIFVSGEFDVDIKTENPFYKHSFYMYNLDSYIPEKVQITLSERRNTLDTNLSAAKQGHPFYWGSVTYEFTADVPADFCNYVISVKGAVCGAGVSVNGGEFKNVLFAPYTVECSEKGNVKISVKTHTTAANFMEMYQRDFGLTEGVEIIKI